MAESALTICNKALGEIGSTQFVDDIDSPATKAEKYCAQHFNPAIDYVITEAPWVACLADKEISFDVVTPDDENFTYRYTFPSDPYCVKPLYIIDNPDSPFVVQDRYLFCNVQYNGKITLKYSKRITTYDNCLPKMQRLMVLKLAEFLAIPMAEDRKAAFFLSQKYDMLLPRAIGENEPLLYTLGMGFFLKERIPDEEGESWLD
ncbi:MAG TPA: hypothetical protein ENH40_02470 [Nitrospirae bacterium]|nr:hypothetical protein [Nitrospirota bacterium]